MRDYIVEHNIPNERILLETKSKNTVENIIYSKEIMNIYRLKTSVLVSNSFHLRRMMLITRALDFSAAYHTNRSTSVILNQIGLTYKEIFLYRVTRAAIKHFEQKS